MNGLDKVLYRKWLEYARQIRVSKAPPSHCVITGLDFNARTRAVLYWGCMNSIQKLRGSNAAAR